MRPQVEVVYIKNKLVRLRYPGKFQGIIDLSKTNRYLSRICALKKKISSLNLLAFLVRQGKGHRNVIISAFRFQGMQREFFITICHAWTVIRRRISQHDKDNSTYIILNTKRKMKRKSHSVDLIPYNQIERLTVYQ